MLQEEAWWTYSGSRPGEIWRDSSNGEKGQPVGPTDTSFPAPRWLAITAGQLLGGTQRPACQAACDPKSPLTALPRFSGTMGSSRIAGTGPCRPENIHHFG